MSPTFFFFLQAEAGIRDVAVTGVQPCALPISRRRRRRRATCRNARRHVGTLHVARGLPHGRRQHWRATCRRAVEIGRASCRERVEISVGAVSLKKKKEKRKRIRRPRLIETDRG